MHRYQDLILIFKQCFNAEFNTQLVKGEDEPIYLPADEGREFHAIYFANGFFSSALHECAHWLVAGAERRKLIDFGYWYEPDGRDAKQQALFQQVEVKPQAIEWILSVACGYRFQVSIDNLSGQGSDTQGFKNEVYQQVLFYCEKGLPKRAEQLRVALSRFYGTPSKLCSEHFTPLH